MRWDLLGPGRSPVSAEGPARGWGEAVAAVPLPPAPSDLPKLKSLPGLNGLVGDWTFSVPVSRFVSGDFRNLKLRKPGSLFSLPVGDWGDLAAVVPPAPPERNLPCKGMICFSFITLLVARRELGRLGLSVPCDAAPELFPLLWLFS